VTISNRHNDCHKIVTNSNIKKTMSCSELSTAAKGFCDDYNRHCDDYVTIIKNATSTNKIKGETHFCDDVTIFSLYYGREKEKNKNNVEGLYRACARVCPRYSIRRKFDTEANVRQAKREVKQMKLDTTISIRLPEETRRRLSTAAEQDGRSMSNYLVRILTQHLEVMREAE